MPTKEDAEKKKCPFIKDWERTGIAYHINCITDRCMAWEPWTFDREKIRGSCKLLERGGAR